MTRRERIAIVWLVVATLFLGGAASAGDAKSYPPPEGWGSAELRIAVAYWGVPTPPLCESTSVEFDAVLPPEIAGLATRPTEAGTHCWMKIAPARPGGLYYHCLVVVHEFGHWLGLSHSEDTSSPMAAELNPTIRVRGCERLANVTKRTHKPRLMR